MVLPFSTLFDGKSTTSVCVHEPRRLRFVRCCESCYLTTLQHYNRNVLSKIRGNEKMPDESFVECTVRMRDVAQKWTKECRTKDDVLEMVMIEQFQKFSRQSYRFKSVKDAQRL